MRGESIHSNADVDAHVEVRDSNEFVESGTLDSIQMVVKRFGNEKYISGHGVYSPFWEALQFLFGFEQMMVNLSMNPSLVEHTLERITVRTIERLKAYAECGVTGDWLEYCFSSVSDNDSKS